MPATLAEARETVIDRLKNNPRAWMENVCYIRDKSKNLVKLELPPGQSALEEIFEGQRAANQPERAVVLKARQVGISTMMQARMIHQATTRGNQEVVCLAHNRDTGGKLFRMGEAAYARLPEDEEMGLGSSPTEERICFISATGARRRG